MKLRIRSDGAGYNTQVAVVQQEPDGRVAEALLEGVQKVEWSCVTGGLATAVITVVKVPILAEAKARVRSSAAKRGRGRTMSTKQKKATTVRNADLSRRSDLEAAVRRELRVREQLPARELAARLGVSVKALPSVLAHLVSSGEAVKHKGATTRAGDRAPRYSKPSRAKA